MEIVTVGCGMAAAEFVTTLRENGFKKNITMVSNEPFIPYSPCSIPFFISGEPLETVFWKRRDFFKRYNIKAILNDAVINIDTNKKVVNTQKGRHIPYDKLLFAPGSRSFFPQEEWLKTNGVFGFKNLTDIISIDKYIKKEKVKNALVFGGGFIGVDAALSLWKRRLNVTLVHRNNRVLSQMTDIEGGVFATERLREKTGINIILKKVVKDIYSKDGKITGVLLSDNTFMNIDLLIITIGVRPNSELLGIEGGIKVDDSLKYDDSIYVAGDVALTKHLITGSHGIYATYPNARIQARGAAYNILFNKNIFRGSINTNVLKKHIDFPIISAGIFEGEVIAYQNNNIFRKIYLKDDKINGYILVGDTLISGFIYNLYITQKKIGKQIDNYLSLKKGKAYYIYALSS
ncbi:MAG: FAD-dependent oxidoreductase [Deferribacterota bacterium]|nr:FAD-dependent oxidoreductase [Deferribacterota bacterium]